MLSPLNLHAKHVLFTMHIENTQKCRIKGDTIPVLYQRVKYLSMTVGAFLSSITTAYNLTKEDPQSRTTNNVTHKIFLNPVTLNKWFDDDLHAFLILYTDCK